MGKEETVCNDWALGHTAVWSVRIKVRGSKGDSEKTGTPQREGK